MAYQPKRVANGGTLSGTAKVQIAKSGKKVRVEFEPAVQGAEDFYVLDKSNCPEYVMTGEYMVSLDSKGEKMYSMRPVEGLYVGKVQKFVSEKDKPPTPKTVNVAPKQGNPYSFEAFTVLLEVTRGTEKGMVIPYNLRYHFSKTKEDVKGNEEITVAYGHLKSKYTGVLEEFMDTTGAWEQGPMKYSDNVLPMIEKRILRQAKEFNILLKGGWVDKVFPLQKEIVKETIAEEEPIAENFEDVASEAEELPWEEVTE